MRILVVVLLVLLLVPGWAGLSRLPLPRIMSGERAIITATPVALDPEDPARRRVGRLTYLGGVVLDSPDSAWGGYSAMSVTGGRFTLLSDGGNIARFTLDRRWRVNDASLSVLPAGPGAGWLKEDRDSESSTVDPETGRVWVGFERANAIWRYAPGFAGWQRWSRPPAMRDWPNAGGAEAMVRLRDGGFIVVSEQAGVHGGRRAIRFSSDPTERPRAGFRFVYLPPSRYEPSDMAELPDGRLLVLNRRFRLPFDFTAKLTIVDPAAIRPGARVQGREIATLAGPLLHDNFEALAVGVEGDATILWIASDDNETVLERTLLLKFRLDPDA